MSFSFETMARVQAGLDAAIDRGVERAATYVRDTAKELCPVASGDLRDSIRVEGEAGTMTREVIAGGGNTGVTYAHFVEYGTHDSPAQPFLTPVRARIKPEIEIEIEIRKLIGAGS